MHPKVSIIIIHYNTPQYLKSCFEGIFSQTYPNIELIFIDNNSMDKSGLEFVREEYGGRESLKIVPNEDNLGYAKAANQGIKMGIDGGADYLVITNPDIIYTSTYFEKIIARMEQDNKIAAITGKVYKYDFDRNQPTNIIDTAGLFAYKNRRIIDDGQGLIDEGQFDEECEVFGVSGACPLYRKSALEDVKVMGEYLDEDFFMYKEDVDISWRMRLFGWACFYDPQAIGFHGRGTGAVLRKNLVEVAKKRSDLSKFQRGLSYRNERLMRLKNEFLSMFFGNAHNILLKEFLFLGLMLSSERFLFKSFFEILRYAPRAFKKRRIIQRRKIISARDLRRWFI